MQPFQMYLQLGFEHISDLAGFDHILCIVAVSRNDPITMCNHNKISESIFLPREDHNPVGRRKDRSAYWGSNVDALMERSSVGEWRDAVAKTGSDPASHRPKCRNRFEQGFSLTQMCQKLMNPLILFSIHGAASSKLP